MTKKQLEFLNKVLEDETTKGKKYLRAFIWRNTVKTKYSIGDKVCFSEYSMRVYGQKVIDFYGQITDIIFWSIEKTYTYKITFTCVLESGEEYTTQACTKETNIQKTKKKELKNYLVKKSDCKECLCL